METCDPVPGMEEGGLLHMVCSQSLAACFSPLLSSLPCGRGSAESGCFFLFLLMFSMLLLSQVFGSIWKWLFSKIWL